MLLKIIRKVLALQLLAESICMETESLFRRLIPCTQQCWTFLRSIQCNCGICQQWTWYFSSESAKISENKTSEYSLQVLEQHKQHFCEKCKTK